MPKLRSVTVKKGTHTKHIYSEDRKTTVNGVTVCMKGDSYTADQAGDDSSPYIERAAYLVDRMLGFNFVPTTVLRIHEGCVVSCQR